jgi:hypothetical protein
VRALPSSRARAKAQCAPLTWLWPPAEQADHAFFTAQHPTAAAGLASARLKSGGLD